MKKISVVISLIFFLALQSVSAQYWKSIRIGTEGAYPPFNELDPNGNPIGFDVDIAKALCKEMKSKCTFVIQDWDGMIPALLAKKYDAIIASMSITDERKKKVAFTNKYYETPAGWVAKTGMFSDANETSLKGKNIGVQVGTIFANYVDAKHGKSANIKKYKTMDEVYLDIAAGRIDIFMGDVLQIDDSFLKQSQGRDYQFVGDFLSDRAYFGDGIGIAIRKGDPKLVQKFNKAIKAIRNNGEYDRIRKAYFEFDIYGE